MMQSRRAAGPEPCAMQLSCACQSFALKLFCSAAQLLGALMFVANPMRRGPSREALKPVAFDTNFEPTKPNDAAQCKPPLNRARPAPARPTSSSHRRQAGSDNMTPAGPDARIPAGLRGQFVAMPSEMLDRIDRLSELQAAEQARENSHAARRSAVLARGQQKAAEVAEKEATKARRRLRAAGVSTTLDQG